jgi:hypothetical protein
MNSLITSLESTPILSTIITKETLLTGVSELKGEPFYKSSLNWTAEEMLGTTEIDLIERRKRDDTVEYLNSKNSELVFTLIGLKIPIPKKLSIKNSDINRAYELSASCLVPETSSSSPSMILHQLVSLMLIDMLPGLFTFEEQTGRVRPDLIWKLGAATIYIDVTTEVHHHKVANYEVKTYNSLLIVNKYEFVPDIREIKWLSVLSHSIDKRDSTVQYRLILDQAKISNSDMLYTKKTLDYFNNSEDLEDDRIVLSYGLNMLITEDKTYLVEPDQIALNWISDQMMVIKSKIHAKSKLVRSNYCFPNSQMFNELAINLTEFYLNIPFASQTGKQPTVINEAGQLSYEENYDPSDYYTLIRSKLRVNNKAYESYSDYPAVRQELRRNSREQVNAAMKIYKTFTATYHYLEQQAIRRCGFKIDVRTGKVYDKLIPYPDSNDEIPESEPELYPFHIKIDPDHMSLLKENKVADKTIKYLSRNRDYHEARMKRKIVSALKSNYRDGTRMIIRHWAKADMYAEVLVSGLLFSDEKGVVYVSYFMAEKLYRTELWRLTDVENYESLPERMLSLVLGTISISAKYTSYYNYLSVAFRIMMEGSWGASRWLKPLRYLSSGVVMGSTLLRKTMEKVIKEMKEEDFKRRSTFLLFESMSKQKFEYGKTPFFGFDFVDIGYECFLYDLCPRKTYGRKRHLRAAMVDMIDEVGLYNKNYGFISELYKDFEDIIEIDERSDRNKRWMNHLKMILSLSEKSDKRFTFSPASVVLLSRKILNMGSKRLLQGSSRSLSDLTTGKASYCSVSGESKMACESISNLAKEENTSSTTRLAIKILFKPVDLTMRMFDKPQVGGNREISILSSPFRIIQSILEDFGKKIAEASATDILDRSDKFSILANSFTDCLTAPDRLILTADQTRWGPNFSTVTFGLMYQLLSRVTTEFFVPALSCLLSEFKVFELPLWIPDLFVQSNAMYSVPGALGRSHMGQGIFHRSSSLFHSLVLDLFTDELQTSLLSSGITKDDISIAKFCTSDDMVLMGWLSKFRSRKVTDAAKMVELRRFMSKLPSFLIFFCIKTSDYKNILSATKGEMNSWYFSKDGLGSNDLKFINSLVEPQTSANFLRDMQNPYNAFDNSLNSGCSLEVAKSIFYSSYLLRLRQWRIKVSNVGFPSEDRMKDGLPAVTAQDKDNLSWLNFVTKNNFRTKQRIKEVTGPKTENLLTSMVISETMKSISDSTGPQSYKNMIVRFKKNEMVLAPFNRKLVDIGILSMTYESFLYNINNDPTFIQSLSEVSKQPHIIQVISHSQVKVKMFGVLRLKTSFSENVDAMTLAVSSIPTSETLKSGFTGTELITHLYRRHKRFSSDDMLVANIDKSSFEAAYISAKELLDDFSMSGGGSYCTVHTPIERTIEYQQIYKIPVGIPFRLTAYNSIKYGIPDYDIDPDQRYSPDESTYIAYGVIDLISIYIKGPTPEFFSQPSKEVPKTSKLVYDLYQRNITNIKVNSVTELAYYEFMYQVANQTCTLVNGEPKYVFLNYSTIEMSDDVPDEDEGQMDFDIKDDLPFETMSKISSQFPTVEASSKKIEVKADVFNFEEEIGTEMQRVIREAFNMVSDETDEIIDEDQFEFSKDVDLNSIDDFSDGGPGELMGFKLKKKSIVSKSVMIDWRYIVFSNNYTLKRAIFLDYLRELLDAKVILGNHDNPMMLAQDNSNLVYFDPRFPRIMNEICSISFANALNTTPRDKNRILSSIRHLKMDFKKEDLVNIPFVYSVTGRPKNIVVSKLEFEKDYDSKRIMC